MNFGKTLLTAFAGGLIALLGIHFVNPPPDKAAHQPTAFERVMQTKTIRCGYVVVAPLLVKDAATGQLSGPVYDVVTAIGKVLNLKIDWTEETTYAEQVEGLRTNRYDMACSHIYLRPNLMQHVEFTQPYYYIPIQVVQRKGETRFKTIADIDQPEVTIGAIDGTIPALIAADDFKVAKTYSLPEHTDYSDNLLVLTTHKADVTFIDPVIFHAFDKNNLGQLEINSSLPPLRTFGTVFVVKKGEHDLVTMLSAALQHLLNNGQIDKIIAQHEDIPGTFLRVSKPYVTSDPK